MSLEWEVQKFFADSLIWNHHLRYLSWVNLEILHIFSHNSYTATNFSKTKQNYYKRCKDTAKTCFLHAYD